jgi:hypothetical protein
MLDFSGADPANQTIVHNELGTLTPTVADCLDLGLKIAVAATKAKRPKQFKAWKKAFAIVEPKLTEEYKLAAVPLADQLGTYCSYCETHLPGLIEVEHRLPKACYPTFMLEWDHLLIACGPCNTKKGSRPDRDTVQKWLTRDIKNEDECRHEIRDNHFCWPDRNSASYRNLRPTLFADALQNGNWAQVHLPDACNLANQVTGTFTATRTVRANVANVGNDIPVSVQLVGSNNKALEMITLLKLNTDGATNTTYDRRMMNRTLAWFRVLQAVQPLISPGLSPASFPAVWQNAMGIAKFAGFYSVWVTVLARFTDPMTAGQTLAERFVQDPTTDYLHTDTTSIP